MKGKGSWPAGCSWSPARETVKCFWDVPPGLGHGPGGQRTPHLSSSKALTREALAALALEFFPLTWTE